MYSSKAEAPDKNILSNKVLTMLARENGAGIHEQTRKKLYLAAMAVFSSREVSMQEVAWYLLDYPFVIASRVVLNINVLPPSMRQHQLRPIEEIAKLPDDSTSIFL
jgi:hypothetical protein